MTFPDILIGIAVASFIAVAWLIRQFRNAPIGFETWHGLRIGTPTYDPVDEHAQHLGIGGGDIVQHRQPTSPREQRNRG